MDIETKLREALDGVTPGPWVAKQTVIHKNEYGGWWLEGIDLDPEDATRPERLILISGSGGARSYTTRIIDRQIHDDNEANMKWFALCSPDNIGTLLAERAADRATIASLRSKLEEAEGALKAAREFIADEFNDDRYEESGEWLSPEARDVHKQLCEAEVALSALREADHA